MSSEEVSISSESMPQYIRNKLNHYLFDLSSVGGRVTNYLILLLIISVLGQLNILNVTDVTHSLHLVATINTTK